MKKQVTLAEFIELNGYTAKEWDDTVGMLCSKGVAKGCYQDYNLLQLVISWLCNYKSEISSVKTKKVILNKDYGGFDISPEGYQLYAKKKGIEKANGKFDFYLDAEHREDPVLIEVIEELGEGANTKFSKLKIVEIPADMEYVIDEYDGIETLHQKVQEW